MADTNPSVAPASTGTPSPAPAVLDKTGQAPAEGVNAWETDLANLSEPPKSSATPPPASPKPSTEPKATPAPQDATKTQQTPSQPPKPPEGDGGRKSKLDPDQLLSFDGDSDVALPKEVVDTLATLPARDLRLQSAKLVQQYRAQAKRLKSMESELTQARTPKDDPEKHSLSEQLTSIRQRNDELERRLKQVAYTESPEYKEKYEAPFVDAMNEAYAYVKEFSVTTPEGTERPATQQDFDALLGMRHGDAIKQAKAMFGDAADQILNRRATLQKLQSDAKRAIDKYKNEGQETERKRTVEETQRQEVRRKIWEEANTEIPKRWSKFFGEIPGDEEGNSILRKGYEMVDQAHDPTLPERDRIFQNAMIRHRAAAFGRAANTAARLAKENAELKKIIEDYENSAPTPKAKDGGTGPADGDGYVDANTEFDRMVASR